ncbi:MAG: hypothetical protein F6K09_11830 [Merismopedia sp. SIO2A8]|nr:hypothetical protein [Merismopedia sp. SIO2A8]
MHQKETVIAPLFAQELGITVTVPDHFDSDRFGTFTRDVAREGTQQQAARAKANAVLDGLGGTVAIASEGAFFPDPMLPFVAYNRELVVLVDREYDLEIIGQASSNQTNFSHKTIQSVEEALEFAATAQFPSHGLVVMPDADCADPGVIVKGIVTETALIQAVEIALRASPTYGSSSHDSSSHGSSTRSVHIETDMRAMYNPTRMEAIAAATRDLITTIQRVCPNCGRPGFSKVGTRPGLPCGLCHLPTELVLADVYQCAGCQHREEKRYPNGIRTADPGQCWNCNP